MSENRSQRLIHIVTSGVFGLIAMLIAADLLIDGREGVSLTHLMLEGFVLVAALCGAGLTLRRFLQVNRDLVIARRDTIHWRDQHRALV